MQSSLANFHPVLRTWFEDTFGSPTPPQALGWPKIDRGENVLLLALTGSGKTLAAPGFPYIANCYPGDPGAWGADSVHFP